MEWERRKADSEPEPEVVKLQLCLAQCVSGAGVPWSGGKCHSPQGASGCVVRMDRRRRLLPATGCGGRGGDLGDGKVKDGTELAICCYFLKLDDSYMDSYCTLLFLCMLEVFIIKNLIKKISLHIVF